MRLHNAYPQSQQRQQVRYIAAVLEDLIDDQNLQAQLRLILKQARGEVVTLLRSQDLTISKHESLAG